MWFNMVYLTNNVVKCIVAHIAIYALLAQPEEHRLDKA